MIILSRDTRSNRLIVQTDAEELAKLLGYAAAADLPGELDSGREIPREEIERISRRAIKLRSFFAAQAERIQRHRAALDEIEAAAIDLEVPPP